MSITRTEDVRLPELSRDATEDDRRMLQALYDQFRDTNQRLWALESTLGIAPRKAATTTLNGTVTSVSVTTANGVSGSVATATTTPAITLTLGAITPTKVTIAEAVGASGLVVTGATQTTNQPAFNVTQTWNAGAVIFTGMKFNVTNTASSAFSMLLDLQVGGTTAFNVRRSGLVTSASSIATLGGTAIPAGGTTGAGVMFSSTANFGVFFGSGAPTLTAAQGSLYLRSDGTTTNDRAYINTDGSTTWTALTTAA